MCKDGNCTFTDIEDGFQEAVENLADTLREEIDKEILSSLYNKALEENLKSESVFGTNTKHTESTITIDQAWETLKRS